MSDALNYLVKARPEAMTHYLKFLKDTGKHLDPKTRNLISVITKVHSQTDRGFRQYLSRALREGAKPAEVLDAILMAFPALGLARIVWAVDILLDMNIPGFSPEALAGVPPVWRDVMPSKEVVNGEVLRREVDGRAVFVYRSGGSTRVYDSRCPHQSTDIPDLALKGLRLVCPKHQWEFDIDDGACVKKGNTPLTRLPSKVAKGVLMVKW
jgi:nitrite reductase/ring-hydroxylating ferredoxin subunit/alkylhydroperoxidase/carboxymuconolactone decarboxylase family protein YurZ